MQTSPSWSSLNARFHRDRAELTGHWDPRPERNSLLYVGLSRDPSLRSVHASAYHHPRPPSELDTPRAPARPAGDPALLSFHEAFRYVSLPRAPAPPPAATVGGDDDDTAAAAKARFAAYTARRLAGAASRPAVAPPPPDHLGTTLARAHTMTNMAPFPRSDRWLHPASRLR